MGWMQKNFLQGMVSADLEKIEINQIQPALICQSKGKIQHVLEIWRTSQHSWVLSSYPGEGFQVANLLDKFHIRENFEFQLLTPSILRLDLRGPRSRNVSKNSGLNVSSSTSETSGIDKKIFAQSIKTQGLNIIAY